MAIVDGKIIALRIKERLKAEVVKMKKAPILTVISIGQDSVGESYVNAKRGFGEEIGISFKEEVFTADEDKGVLKACISRAVRESDGTVIQLPVPETLPKKEILNLVPPEKDPDMLSSFSKELFENCRSEIIPPVAGALSEILSFHGIGVKGKRVVVVGYGQLVGEPAVSWFKCQGVLPVVLVKEDGLESLCEADIVVSGVGKPSLIKPEMVKEGAVLIDAGTSGQSGEVVGDMDPECAKKASLFTPVPGGVGPITIAKLFENFMTLASINK